MDQSSKERLNSELEGEMTSPNNNQDTVIKIVRQIEN